LREGFLSQWRPLRDHRRCLCRAQKVLITPDISGKIGGRGAEGQRVNEGDVLLRSIRYRSASPRSSQGHARPGPHHLRHLVANIKIYQQMIDLAQQAIDLKQRDVDRKATL